MGGKFSEIRLVLRRMKYYELQEAWDAVQATSMLTVPIPAVRRYESASISDATASGHDQGGDACHVLHPLSRAVGVVNFGLNTEDIHLEGGYACTVSQQLPKTRD